jgi:MFS transporter, DHA1 family, tetracycline resistance protein
MSDTNPNAVPSEPVGSVPDVEVGPDNLASATPPASPKTSQAAYIFIFVTILLDMLAFGIIAPVLPNLIVQFEGGNIARAVSITGYFAFAWATMQFIFSPILGAWSDRFGRRPIILISCLGLGLDYIFMAMAPSLGWLFVGRLISGITASNIATAFAYITDVTPPQDRAKRFGMISAAFGLGFIIGPAVGGLLGRYGLRLPFWISAALSLINAIYGFFILPESLPVERRAKSAWHMANPLGSLNLLRSSPELFGLAVVVSLYYLAHQVLPSVFVLYTRYRYGWHETTVGLSLAAVGVCVSLASALLVGPFVKKFGERSSLIAGLLFGTLAFLGYALASRGWMVFASIPLVGLWGIAGPAMQSLMSQRVDPTSQGKLQGAINSVRALTGMIGPLLFTQVFALAISPKVSTPVPGAPWFVAAILMLASAIVAYVVAKPALRTAVAAESPAS